MAESKTAVKAAGKTEATVSNNGPLFDYRRDTPCD